MTNNKKIIEWLKNAQEIVNEAGISEEYKQAAFQKAFDSLASNSVQIKNASESKQSIEPITSPISEVKTFAGFLRQTTSKSHADKILAIIYFYVKSLNKITFTKEDIEKTYQESFLPKSKNTSAEIIGLIKRGLVMNTGEKIDGKKSFKITLAGMNFVEEELMKGGKQ